MSSIVLRGVARHGLLTAAALGLLLASGDDALAQARQTRRDLVYATVEGRDLALDLHWPAGETDPPLLVWVHGGRWSSGTKAQVPSVFVEHGFAVASVDFRQSTEARFPAQVHDIKAAIRFLRARAHELGYRADRIVIGGYSSGGHLAALVGVTNGNRELEGTVGDHLDASSDVQAILSVAGASNLTTILAQSTPFGLSVREPSLEQLLGALPDRVPELARLASPIVHVDAGDPPLALVHGDQDVQMPINQAHELMGAYEKHDLDVHFEVVHGGEHLGDAFYEPEYLEPTLAFLRRAIGR
ncbi:MAG: alpha/beta hydrolase fold domain-containing protein [Gemmatimonadales bacterium]